MVGKKRIDKSQGVRSLEGRGRERGQRVWGEMRSTVDEKQGGGLILLFPHALAIWRKARSLEVG